MIMCTIKETNLETFSTKETEHSDPSFFMSVGKHFNYILESNAVKGFVVGRCHEIWLMREK